MCIEMNINGTKRRPGAQVKPGYEYASGSGHSSQLVSKNG
jgi:hypothetical protein